MLLIDMRKIKKRAVILICFMLIIAAVMVTHKAMDTQVSINIDEVQYRDYTGLDGRFTYKLPSGWKTVDEKQEGSEIIYSISFSSGDNKIHGCTQVWNLNRPAIGFISEFIKCFPGISSFRNLNIEPVKIEGRDGYILQYSKKDDNNKYKKCFEVFIFEEGSNLQRFAFQMDDSLWKNEYRTFLLNTAAYARLK